MDKLMDNPWFLRALALLFALMLYTVAGLDKESIANKTPSLSVGTITETIPDVPVIARYDNEKYVVTGLPKYVALTLEGPSSAVTAAKLNKKFEVYANLTGDEPGIYDVDLQYKGIDNKIKVKMTPAQVKVTVSEKVKKSFPVEVGFLNGDLLKDGYKPDKITLKPMSVEISGTEEQLQRIGVVKAYVDLKGVTQTVTKEAKIVVYDKRGTPIDIQTLPKVISVTIPVNTPEKKVSVTVTKRGYLPDGVTIGDMVVTPNQVTLYGPKDVLDSVDSLDGIFIDLDKITGNTTLDLPIELPKGVVKSSVDKVRVTIQAQRQEKKEFPDLSLQVTGLADGLRLSFVDPKSGRMPVIASGDVTVIGKLTSSQIQPFIAVQNLTPGTYEVPVQVNTIDDIRLEPKQKTVKIEVIKKS